MKTINVIFDSNLEHRQCRLNKTHVEWKNARVDILSIKIKNLFPNHTLVYKTLADLDQINNWVYPLEIAHVQKVVNIKHFITILPVKILEGKGIILFILRENLLDSDITKIQESIKNQDIAKRIVFLSVHKDNNLNFKHYNVSIFHSRFNNFSDEHYHGSNIFTINNSNCTFIDNYTKRRFCCFLQNYSENPERKYLLSFLEKHNLLNKGFISAKNNAKDFNTTGKGGYSFTSYDSVFNDLDIASTINNSYINIIPEGNFMHRESQCVTEKPLRSFFYRKPFIMINRQHDLKYIRSMGYKTFSPIINESYDNIYSHSNRLAAICIEIKRLMNKPIKQFKKDMEQLADICEHNYSVYITKETNLEKYLYEKIN